MLKISVVLPLYNVEKYIRKCLESIIAQENSGYTIECLIIDDASPDNSMTIVKEIIANYHGFAITFRVIRHEVNKGLSEARNAGIKASTGDFLFFVDSDDELSENTFVRFLDYYQKYPLVDVIIGNSLDFENGILSESHTNESGNLPILVDDKRLIMKKVLKREINRNVWNKLIRRSIVEDNNLLFDVGLLYEDVIWTYRLYSSVSSILIIPELTYLYENNPLSIVHTYTERSNQLVWSFVYISDYLINNPPVFDGKQVLFSDHLLFVNHWMLKAIDIKEQFGGTYKICKKMNEVKRKLLWLTISHCRPVMTLYFLTMFKPFSLLIKLRLFRANIYRISQIVCMLS